MATVLLGDLACSYEETYALQLALIHNCPCKQHGGESDNPERACTVDMMLRDLLLLKHLLFVRQTVQHYLVKEFNEKAKIEATP